MDYIFEEAQDLTPGPYNLEIFPKPAEQISFSSSSNILGELSTVYFTFKPS